MRDRALERRFERFRRKGDVAALGRVFDGAAPELLKVATNLATGLSAAEDLVQATFLTAIERAPSWDRSARLMPWLLGILVRHAHEARRAKAREQGEPSLEEEGAERAPHERAQAAELSASVQSALSTIPEPYRAVLQPFLVEGCGATEIAQATGRAPGTVRMQIHRGLERLRRALPAGLGVALALNVDVGRGLAAMRAEVVTAASASPTVLAAASAAAAGTGTSILGGILGSLTLVKNSILAVVAVALAAGVAWIAWPDPASPEPVRIESELDAGELERPAVPEPEPALPAFEAPAVELPSAQRVEATAPEARLSGSLYERSLAGVSGRLLNHRGEPVANTEVTLLEINPGMFLRAYQVLATGEPPAMEIEAQSARTDGEGSFRLHGVRTSGLHAMGVDLGGPRGTIVFLDHVLNSGEIVELGDVTLEPSGRVTGRVVDEAGRPVAGARVRAAEWPEWVDLMNLREWRKDASLAMGMGEQFMMIELPAWVHAWEPRLPIPTAITGADGRFALEAVHAGRAVPIVDRARHPACSQAEAQVVVDRENDLGDLVLAEGQRVTGRVVDSSGAGLAGVEVRVGALPPDWSKRFPLGVVMRPAVHTDADGRFSVDGLPLAAELTVAARRHPGVAWRYESPHDPTRGEVELTIADDAELTLALTTVGGEVVPDAAVAMAAAGPLTEHDAPAGMSPLRRLPGVERPEPGALVLRDLPPGPHHLRVTAEGFASAVFTLELKPGPNKKQVEMLPARALRVRVLADEDGAALQRCAVSVHVVDTRDPALDGGETDASGEVVLSHVPIEDGRELLLRVEHPGFALQRVPLPADASELEVRMKRGGSVVATVQRGGRPPTTPVFVEVMGRLVKGFDVLVHGNTDAEGRVRIERLMPGEYRYRVYPHFLRQGAFELVDSFAAQPPSLADGRFEIVDGEVLELTIDLDSPSGVPAALECGVSGRFTLDGAPVARADVMLMSPGGERVRNPQVQTSEQGEYEYAGLPPGEYYLICMSAGDRAEQFVGAFQVYERFELSAGEHRLQDFDWTSRTVEVLALDAVDGRALEGVNVMLRFQDKDRGTTTGGVTDEAGVARVLALGTGDYHIDANHPELGMGRTTGQAGLGDDRLTVEVSRGVPCAGELSIANGGTTVAGDGTLYFSNRERGSTRQTTVKVREDRAIFRVVGLEPGDYQVQLHMSDDSFRPIDLTLPEGGDGALALEFVPSGGGSEVRRR